jgi:hypothetical protein
MELIEPAPQALLLCLSTGFVFVIPCLVLIVLCLSDKAKLRLTKFTGYRECTEEVRHRLMPQVWSS